MYPLLATPTRTFLYVLAWVPIALALAAVMYLIEPRPAWTLAAVTGPLCLVYASATTSVWWILRGERSENLLSVGFLFRILGAALVTATLWAIAANMLYTFLDPKLPEFIDVSVRRKDLLLIFLAGLGIYWLSAALHLAFHISLKAVESERRALESQVTAREAELKALRSQLNPHFLFNSLNSIMSLVGRSPEEARRMCQGLGDFLRRTLNLGARERVSFAEEIDLVKHYLEIETVRFGARLTYELDVPAELNAIQVPPLLLQPLIENAVKHGVASRLDGGLIRLRARRDGDNLHVAVINPTDDESAPAGGEGMGLDNVRRRLKATAAGRGTLEIRKRSGEFEAHLVLPARRRSDHPGLDPWGRSDMMTADPIRVLIVDDEEPARALLREYLEADPGVTVVGECPNGFEAVKSVSQLEPDLVMLDIQMPKLNGFEVLELLSPAPAVIFCTAHDEFAVKAFEAHAVDYLLKPVGRERLLQALARYRERVVGAAGSTAPGDHAGALSSVQAEELVRSARPSGRHAERILVRDGVSVHVIPAATIDYLEAQDDYVAIHAAGKTWLKTTTLARLAADLDPARFVQIHRSYLLNLDKLGKVEQLAKDSRVAILKDGRELPMSRSGYARLKERF